MRKLFPVVVALFALLLLAASAVAAPLGGDGKDAIVVISGDVAVEPGETVEDVVVIDGDVRIAGRVDGDVILVAGDALLSGRVGGDLVTVAGRARLLPRARVGGDLLYGEEEPRLAPGALVAGEIDEKGWDALGLLPIIGAFVLWLAVTVSTAVLGILLVLLVPRAADATMAQAESRFWTAVAIGAGVFVGLPLLAFVASITLVGLPLAIGLILALLPLAALGYVAAAWVLGRLIVKPPRDRILAFLAGLAILRAVALIPVLGLLAWLGAVIVGLGLLGAAIIAAREAPAA
jgi:hypothetical protein